MATQSPTRRARQVQPGSGPHDRIAKASAPIPLRLSRRASREYVAGALGLVYAREQLRALPVPFDDLARDFGPDIYEQMALDPQVASCLTVFKSSILEDGAHVSSPIEDQDHPDYALGLEIRNAAARMFERMTTPLEDVLWTMLDGIFLGNKIAEITCQLQAADGTPSSGPGSTLNVVAIKPKPRQLVHFVVDAYMNVVGFIGARPGQATPWVSGTYFSPQAVDVLPRDKFMVFSHRPENGDPRGTSILRPAYEPWWRKRQMTPEYLRYLSQFAGPSIWGTAPEDVQPQPSTDGLGNLTISDGTLVADPDALTDDEQDDIAANDPSPQEALLTTILELRNGTAAAFPFGTELHTIEMSGDGSAFLTCFSECNQEIVKAILTQTLATEEGQNMARAAASVHQDVLDTLIRQGKKAVCRMLAYDVLLPWVERNWGSAKNHLVPLVTLGTTEGHDLADMMAGIAQLQRSNFIHPSQFAYYDGLLGAPVRDLTVAPLVPVLPGAAAPGEPGNAGDGAGTGGSGNGQGPRTAPADRARRPAKPAPARPGGR